MRADDTAHQQNAKFESDGCAAVGEEISDDER
jgi:hypothetical protein